MPESNTLSVLVVVGVGGMGLTIARLLSRDKFVFLVNFNQVRIDKHS